MDYIENEYHPIPDYGPFAESISGHYRGFELFIRDIEFP